MSRASASSSSRATTPSSGLVWRSERSARRTRRSGGAPASASASSSSASPAPKAAWISGANASMSGHITITSRASRVGSSASMWRIASRSTSTWRERPWQACTCRLRSPGSSSGRRSGSPGSGAPGGGRSARTSACSRPSSVSAGASSGWCASRAAPPAAGDDLHLARVAAPGGQQRVAGQPGGRVLPPAPRGCPAEQGLVHPPPEGGGGVQQQQVDLAPGRERGEHVDVAGRQAGQAEEREAGGQPGHLRLASQARAGPLEPLGRAGDRQPAAQAPPQFRLPAGVAGQGRAGRVDVVAGRPGAQHGRAVDRVAVEQVGGVAGAGEAARAAGGVGVRPGAAEVRGQRRQPGLVHAGVDDLQQRPDRPLGQPGVAVAIDAARGRDRTAHQPAREGEVDVRADAVGAAGGGAEAGRQPLREPALDAAGGDGDHLGGERIGRRLEQQVAEGGGQAVRALGAVDGQHAGTGPFRTPSR